MPESDPIIVSGLNHWFGQGEARKQAIFDVNLVIARGKLTVLMGPSEYGVNDGLINVASTTQRRCYR